MDSMIGLAAGWRSPTAATRWEVLRWCWAVGAVVGAAVQTTAGAGEGEAGAGSMVEGWGVEPKRKS